MARVNNEVSILASGERVMVIDLNAGLQEMSLVFCVLDDQHNRQTKPYGPPLPRCAPFARTHQAR